MTDTTMMHYLKPGLGNASSYQVSGKPFVTGGLAIPALGSAPLQVSFDTVSKKVIILNTGNQDVRVGFSSAGVSGSNYVLVNKKDGSTHGMLQLEVKCTSVFLLSAGFVTTADVAAELTNIPASELLTNWSGSAGIG